MTDLYQSITERIIGALESGAIPWQFPWKREPGGAMPANLSTGRLYRGINTLLLNMTAMHEGYRAESPAPTRGAFYLLALGGYMRATRYKTPYRWLHGGYTGREKKNPAIFWIAGFPLLTWCRRDESNTRPSHYE